MLFIWGSKTKRKVLGYVAEWCGRCQCAASGALVEARKTSHAYYVPLGGGRVLGHEFLCSRCGTATATEATRYASVGYAADAPLQELLQYTNPQLNAALQQGGRPGAR